jgi:hypothetical protein
MKMFFTGVKLTKQKGFCPLNLAAYWKRKYRGILLNEGWYILTNLGSLSSAVKAYQARTGIEAMFKDCKTGGYNLEGCHACESRLMSLILIIAIAYTCGLFSGKKIKNIGLQKYISRLTELGRVSRRHSSFWVGLYGYIWVAGMEFLSDLVSKFWQLAPNQLPHFQRGLRAMELIQSTF